MIGMKALVPDSVTPAGVDRPFAALQYKSHTLRAEVTSSVAVLSQEYLTFDVIMLETMLGIWSFRHAQEARAFGPLGQLLYVCYRKSHINGNGLFDKDTEDF
jgi:hypothetical protein